MRILLLTSHSDRPEAETFIALHNQGYELSVLCPDTAPHFNRLIESGVEVIPLDLQSRIDIKAIKTIRSLLKERQFDILHMFNNKAVSNGILASYGMRNLKLIAYRGIVGNVSYFDPASWMTYLHPRIDKIICVANAIRDFFHQMQFLFHRFPKDKALTIYKGHKLEWYQNPPVELSEFGIPKSSFVIGCIANNRPRKGISYLIEAIHRIEKYPDIHLLLIGHMKSGKLLSTIQASDYKDRIHLTGYREDAPQIIASCQTAVLPAIKREGLPKAIIEAMVYRVPPIVTDSGGSPELIIHNESGFIVPIKDSNAIADAVLKLYKDKNLIDKMGFAAQQRIDQSFNHSDTVKNTIALYQDLISA